MHYFGFMEMTEMNSRNSPKARSMKTEVGMVSGQALVSLSADDSEKKMHI